MKPAERKKLAAGFRKLAQRAEVIEAAAMQVHDDSPHDRAAYPFTMQSPFTCNATRALGIDAHIAYRAIVAGNEPELWSDPDCPSIRVVMLCFAAAMAETGDLL